MLRESLGQHDRAIKHYGEYARRFKDKSDAKEVAFHIGVVHEEQKDWSRRRAELRRLREPYPATRKTVEALTREADADLKGGNEPCRSSARSRCR